MAFRGTLNRLSQLVVDVFRTAPPGERRIEIRTPTAPASGNRLHSVDFIEERPYENGPASLFSFVDGNAASSNYGRGWFQINGARSGLKGGPVPTTPKAWPSLLMISDRLDQPQADPAQADTFATLAAHRVLIDGGDAAGGKADMEAKEVTLTGERILLRGSGNGKAPKFAGNFGWSNYWEDSDGWVAFPGVSGGAVYGGGWPNPVYRIDQGWVECIGLLRNSAPFAWNNGTIIGQFPAAHSPDSSHILRGTGNDWHLTFTIEGTTQAGGSPRGYLVIRTTPGAINPGGWVSLNGLRWPISGK